ncbi:MAG: cupin domain-containing protein [Candidatus Binatia bacterium]
MTENSTIRIGALSINYLLDGSAAGTAGMFEVEVPSGAMVPPPHSHTHNEECVYVLEGTLRYSVDGHVRDLGPGDSMYSPKGSVHAFSNPHSELARVLIFNTPDIGAQYFREIADVVNAGGPPDKTALFAVMNRYGLVPAPPNPD